MYNMKKQLLTVFVFMLTVLFGSSSLMAQGVTTASVSGRVLDDGNEGLPGVNIIAIHEPSGTKYGGSSTSNGSFQIRNMKIGGPYSFEATFVGYETQKVENVYLKLGESFPLQIQMSSSLTELMAVEITAESGVINNDRTGAQTSVNSEAIRIMPTISRSQKDLTRLTPQSDGNSFGGRNSLYNNFSLDGSIFNNSFGLDVATPGGQADANPVSMDAIDQVQVSLAPFDVRQGGFTGAGINAVTRSGTNEIKGTVYTFLRNESMIGSKVDGIDAPNLNYNSNIYGLSVGGPLVKNKLFFFVNAEGVRRNELAHGFVALKDDGSNAGEPSTTSVLESDIQAVQDHYKTQWGYDPGAYQGYTHETFNNKFLAKIDWNISDKHSLMVRYNFLDAYKDILPHPEAIIGRGPTSYRLPFENSSYRIFNKISSYVAELNSNISSNLSNNMMISYTEFRDHREPKSAPFPVVDIWNANGQLAITAGSEMFSTNNVLDQNVLQFTNNLTWFQNAHTWTFGVNYEQFKFDNSFNLFYYPWYTAFSVNDFLNDNLVPFAGNASGDLNQDVINNSGAFTLSTIKVGQLGLYGQDEIQVNERFKLTLGLRIDVPIYLSEIAPDAEVQNFTGWVNPDGTPATVDPSTFPKNNIMWSPRVGFNWDAKGDRSLQVRGGTGIFTGRIPFVWLGNQASNAKMFPGYTFQINDTAEDFKFPQVWKTNLGIDKRFDNGLVATFEGIFGKDINAVVHRNYDMLAPSGNLTGTGDTRAIFGGFNETHIYAADANAIGFLDAGAIVMENAKEGFQLSLTGGLSKTLDNGFSVSTFYTYQNSKDLTSIPAEIAADAFQRNPVVGNPNESNFSWSRYGLTHRAIASMSYKIDHGKLSSSFGGFFEYGKGGRYSYTYAGDVNLDGIPANNDLLYVPANASDINFGSVDGTGVGVAAADASNQYAALNAFIEQDPYLSTRRGDYAERHGAQLPGFGQFDFKFIESFNFDISGKPNQLQLSFDILNLGNLINSGWGVRQFANNTNPISVNGVDNNGTPWFSFDTTLKDSYINNVSLVSKWQMQVGVRWIFNGL